MLNWLKDIFSPLRVNDPELGPLRYLRDTRTWEGWLHFRPTATRVEILLTGSMHGPTPAQREFLKLLEQRYEALWPSVRQMLLEALPQPDKPAGPFVLKAIDLPETLAADAEWELCYEVLPATELSFFVVQLRDWRPLNVSVEC